MKGLVGDISDDEHMNKWKKPFNMVLNRHGIISGKVLPLVYEMANHHKMRMWTALPNRREEKSRPSMGQTRYSRWACLLVIITPPEISADLLLPLVQIC